MLKTAPHYRDPIESLRNHPEYYDFCRNNNGSATLSRFAHWVLHFTCEPNNTFLGSSESDIDEHQRAGGNFILSIGHHHAADITAGAASLRQSRVLRPIIPRLNVYAKEPLHHIGEDGLVPDDNKWAFIANSKPVGLLVNKGIRTVFDNYLARRTFREGDYKDYLASIKSPTERAAAEELIKGWVKSAGKMNTEEGIRRLNIGGSEVIFPEATRRLDFTHVGPLKWGITKMAYGVDDPARTMILPMAIDHGPNLEKKSTPDAVFGELIPIDRSQPQEESLQVVHTGMQECVDNTPTMLAMAA